jgi:hypothetical protein
MSYTIRVTNPASGAYVSWVSDSRRSVLRQASIEVRAGAHVTVTNDARNTTIYQHPKEKAATRQP